MLRARIIHFWYLTGQRKYQYRWCLWDAAPARWAYLWFKYKWEGCWKRVKGTRDAVYVGAYIYIKAGGVWRWALGAGLPLTVHRSSYTVPTVELSLLTEIYEERLIRRDLRGKIHMVHPYDMWKLSVSDAPFAPCQPHPLLLSVRSRITWVYCSRTATGLGQGPMVIQIDQKKKLSLLWGTHVPGWPSGIPSWGTVEDEPQVLQGFDWPDHIVRVGVWVEKDEPAGRGVGSSCGCWKDISLVLSASPTHHTLVVSAWALRVLITSSQSRVQAKSIPLSTYIPKEEFAHSCMWWRSGDV